MAEEATLDEVPEHLRASVLELAGALAEDWPEHDTSYLMVEAARVVMEEHEQERQALVHQELLTRRAVVLGAGVAVLGVVLGSQVLAGMSNYSTLAMLAEERQELLDVVPALVERQNQLIEPLIELGADAELLEASAVPSDAPLDEQLELAIDLQRTLDIEHAASVPASRALRVEWARLDDELEAGRDAFRQLDARLELNGLSAEDTRSGWWGTRWMARFEGS